MLKSKVKMGKINIGEKEDQIRLSRVFPAKESVYYFSGTGKGKIYFSKIII